MRAAHTLHIEPRNVYGAWRLYPVNETARKLAEIAGTKTLEPRVIRSAVTDLGLGLHITVAGASELATALIFPKGGRHGP